MKRVVNPRMSGWCENRQEDDGSHLKCGYVMQQANDHRKEMVCACTCHGPF